MHFIRMQPTTINRKQLRYKSAACLQWDGYDNLSYLEEEQIFICQLELCSTIVMQREEEKVKNNDYSIMTLMTI